MAPDPAREARAEAVRADIRRRWDERQGATLSVDRGDTRLEFYRPPDYILDADGEIVGVDAWVRLYDARGVEVRIDPHRRIINPPTVPRSGIREAPDTPRELTVNAAEAFIEAVVDSVQRVPNPKGWRTRGTVTTVFATTGDGFIITDSSSYTSARAGSGATVDTTTSPARAGQVTGVDQYRCPETFVSFDTSAIADSDVVSSVDLTLYMGVQVSSNHFTLEARTKDWGATLTTGDYVAGASLSGLPLLASLSTTAILGGSQALTSEAAFLTATGMKTGVVYVMLSSSRHRLGNTASGNEYVQIWTADFTGTTQDPALTITHAGLGSMPPIQHNPQRIWRRF